MNIPTTGANSQSQRPLIVLDRDGVINRDSSAFIKSPEEWIALPGSAEAIGQLCEAGFGVIVATNQSGVGRGLFSAATLESIHDKMTQTITAAGGILDAIFVCPHAPDDGCDCRKPKPGLLQQIIKAYNREPAELIVIGDSLRDLEAAWAIGARAILVRTGNGLTTEQTLPTSPPVEIFDDLAAFASFITA